MDMSSHPSSSTEGNTNPSQHGGMASLFFQSTSTPLFASALTPETPAQYVGTLFFLVMLGVVLRVLLALRPVFEATVWLRRPSVAEGGRGEGMLLDVDRDHDAERGGKEVGGGMRRYDNVTAAATVPRVASGAGGVWMEVRERWRGTTMLKSLARAMYEVLLAGVGYLLMLAVMTMNVGYFLAVLGGVFVGTFMLGNLAGMTSKGEDGQTQHC